METLVLRIAEDWTHLKRYHHNVKQLLKELYRGSHRLNLIEDDYFCPWERYCVSGGKEIIKTLIKH